MTEACKIMNGMKKKNREVITHCFSEETNTGHPVKFSGSTSVTQPVNEVLFLSGQGAISAKVKLSSKVRETFQGDKCVEAGGQVGSREGGGGRRYPTLVLFLTLPLSTAPSAAGGRTPERWAAAVPVGALAAVIIS